jgi:hypothetical protein
MCGRMTDTSEVIHTWSSRKQDKRKSDVRLRVPAQLVDATPFKLLIGQRFPVENRNVRL